MGGRVSSASAKTWYLWQNSILLWAHIFFPVFVNSPRNSKENDTKSSFVSC